MAAALGVYLLFGLLWVSLPGVYHDELLFLDASLPGTPVGPVAKLEIFGRQIPLMLMPYLGALKGLLWRGVFVLWAPSVYSVRIPAVLLGGLALALFYLWARRFYPPETALVALALAATDPTWIFTARLDWGPVVLAHVFCFGGLLLGTHWFLKEPNGAAARGGRWLVWLAGAGFCFGLGLWDKFNFLWFLAALGATLVVLFPRQFAKRLRPAPVAVLAGGLLLGALPLVIYNVRGHEPGTRQVVRWTPPDRTVLFRKCRKLQTTLDGRLVYAVTGGWAMERGPERKTELVQLAYHRVTGWVTEPKVITDVSDWPQFALDGLALLGPSRGTLLPIALVGAGLVAALASGARRPMLFPLLVALLMWAQMLPLLLAGEGAHHFVLAYPFPHLAVAAAGTWLWSRARRWGKLALALALSALLLTQIGWDARYLRAFRQTGGLWNWTDAIYEAGDFLNDARPELVVNLDWGFSYPLRLLTGDRIRQDNFYAEVIFDASQDQEAQVEKLLPLLTRPNTLFLMHPEPLDNFPPVRIVFEQALKKRGLQARPVRAFFHRTWDAALVLVRIEPAPPPR